MRESSRPVEEGPGQLCKDEAMAEVRLRGDRKKMFGVTETHFGETL